MLPKSRPLRRDNGASVLVRSAHGCNRLQTDQRQLLYAGAPPTIGVASDWTAFRAVASRPANQSLEHVLSDTSGKWAILCELDVVVLGASPEIAARIDNELEQHGTSLKQMTVWDYPDTLSSDPRYSYMQAVVGLKPAGAP